MFVFRLIGAFSVSKCKLFITAHNDVDVNDVTIRQLIKKYTYY